MENVDPVLTPAGASPAVDSGDQVVPPRSKLLASLWSSKRLVIGLGVVVALLLFCFLGPLVYHPSASTVNPVNANNPPGSGSPLGTDEYGVDVLYRLMTGGQASLELSFAVAIASTMIGMIYGSISGMAGGAADGLMMRILDVILAVPTFILLIIFATMFNLDLATIIVVLSLLSWPPVARLLRGQVLVLRERDFVRAASTFGAGRRWTLTRHIMPSTLNIVVVSATFTVADSIYALSALSFLGLGPQAPFSDWGTMLTHGVDNLFNGYWWQVYPVLIVLVVTVLAVRQVGDALNDLLSARAR